LCWSQAIIYLSAPLQSLLSLTGTRREPDAGHPDRANISSGNNVANEGRLGMQVGLVVASLLIFAFAASLWPVSNRVPFWYAFYDPQPLIIPKSQPPLLPSPTPTPTSRPGEDQPPAPTFTPPGTPADDSATPPPPASATPVPAASNTPAPAASDTPAAPPPTDPPPTEPATP